jgi:hypothetical protein
VNQKIYKQLMADTGGDVTKITREYVAQTFDALIDQTYKTWNSGPLLLTTIVYTDTFLNIGKQI